MIVPIPTTTLLLKVFCQRNFVPDFIQLKLSFIQKKDKFAFSATRWKARVQLHIRHN